MQQAGNDQVRVIAGRHMGSQRAPAQDIVPGEGHEHCMLDIVIERIAVADAFQRDARDRRNCFG
jgi:hypothetical protein